MTTRTKEDIIQEMQTHFKRIDELLTHLENTLPHNEMIQVYREMIQDGHEGSVR